MSFEAQTSIFTVLIVDDNALFRWSVSEMLERAGYRVEGAASASQGMAAIEQAAPDVILLDVRLPDGDGFGVLRLLRESRPDLPVVMLSADASGESVGRALRLGAREYLEKPIEAGLLCAAVARALASRTASAPSAMAGMG